MPPLRTMSIRPQKTERTHEENQERAYIAASRRSDRSLEARMESARRASDIHKKRTGRALRVTEQDVVNEEMYEEEDEDLEAQMRRLTAHIHTGDASFNRRLQSLLTTQMALRMSVANQQGHHPNGANFAPNQYLQSMAAMMNPQMPQMQQMPNMQHMQNNSPNMQNMQTISPQMMAPAGRPQSFRHSPYPSGGMRQPNHQRASSMALPSPAQNAQSPAAHSGTNPFDEQRRMSHPAGTRPTLSRNSSSIHTIKTESPQPGHLTPRHTPSPLQFNADSKHASMNHNNPFFSVPNTPASFDPTQNSGISPLTTTLPMESQALLGPGLDPQDPTMKMFFHPQFYSSDQQNFFNYNIESSKPQSNSSVYPQTLNQTLGPGMPTLDTSANSFNGPFSASDLTSTTTEDFPTLSPDDPGLFDYSSFQMQNSLSRDSSNQGSNGGTGGATEEYNPNDFVDFNGDGF